MKFKKIMFVGILLLAIFAIGAVSASDVNDTAIASEDTTQMELSKDNEIADDNLKTSEENSIVQTENEKTLSTESGPEILGAGEGNYTDLRNDIANGGNLTKSIYRYCEGDGDTIEITTQDIVINGNGAVIDMNGSTDMRAFYVSASGVTIKNLSIKNANYNGDGGAIYFNSSGTVTNCNFFDNTATRYGGAVYFSKTGNVTNCNFINNKVTGTNSGGGAVYFSRTGNVTNCNFTNNKATADYTYGGAIYAYYGTVSNCNFVNNTADYGGAIYWYYINEGVVNYCKFINCGSYYGGATHGGEEINNCIFENCIAVYGGAVCSPSLINNSIFSDCRGEWYGGAVHSGDYSTNVLNSQFNRCISSRGGAICIDYQAKIDNCSFESCNSSSKGDAIYNKGSYVEISGSSFIHTSSESYTKVIFTNNDEPEEHTTIRNCYFEDKYSKRDNFYNGATTSNLTFGFQSELAVDVGDVVCGNDAVITISFSREITGNLLCLVDNTEYPVSISDGRSTVIVQNPNAGIHVVNVTFAGAGMFLAENKVLTFNVGLDPDLKVDAASQYHIGDDVIAEISINETIDEINVKIDSAETLITLENGRYSLNLSSLGIGSHKVEVIFKGNGEFISANSQALFSILSNPEHVGLNEFVNEIDDYYTITLERDYTFENSSSAVSISKNIIIDGNGHTIDARSLSKIFTLNGGCEVVFENIIFKNGLGGVLSGAISSASATCYVYNCTFINCSTKSNGGAIYANKTYIANCSFTNCISSNNGGAIYALDGIIENCSFIDCLASENGGAIYYGGNNVISNCNFKFCYSNQYNGDSIYAKNYVVVCNCSFITYESRQSKAVYGANLQNCSYLFIPQISISANNITIGEYGYIVISGQRFEGNVICLIDGEEYLVNLTSGLDRISISNMNAGIHTIELHFSGNENFIDMNMTERFKIGLDPNIQIDTRQVHDGEIINLDVCISMDKDATGSVTVKIDGVEHPTTFNDGTEIFTLYNVTKGTHLFEVAYETDCLYSSRTQSLKLAVTSNPETTSFADLVSEVDAGSTLILQKDYNITSVISIGKIMTIDGKGHSLKGKGTTRLINCNNYITFKDVIFENGYNSYNNGGGAIRGTSITCIGCTFINCESITNGGAISSSREADINNCTFINCNAKYGGGAIYISGNGYSYYFSPIKYCTFINCSAFNGNGGAIYHEFGNVVGCDFINCTASENGGAIYFKHASDYASDCRFTNCNANYGGAISGGDYIINSIFTECGVESKGIIADAKTTSNCTFINSSISRDDIIYNCEDRNSTFIGKGNPKLQLTVSDIVEGKSEKITVSLKAKGNVTLTINGNNYPINITAGTGSITLNNLNAGRYEVVVIYDGDESFISSTVNKTFKVMKNTNITIYANNINEGESTVVNITIDKDITGGITVCIDNNYTDIEFIEGSASVSILKPSNGSHNVKVVFDGDDIYLASVVEKSFHVKANPKLNISLSDITKNSALLNISIAYAYTGNIKLTLAGNTLDVMLERGKAIVPLNNMEDGDEITVSIINNTYYMDTVQSVIFKAVKESDNPQVVYPAKITASDLKMSYSDGSTFKVTVYGTDGKLASGVSVVIKIAGKNVATLKTNANGVASYKPTEVPGSYKISATALGKTVTKTLTVKQILTLKTVKVKKSAKKLVLQATLAKVNGKYLKSKQITFKFNGKTYKVKTDKKGVAKVTVKKAVLKKLKVGKKVTYQATYLKDTVKKTAKIKK